LKQRPEKFYYVEHHYDSPEGTDFFRAWAGPVCAYPRTHAKKAERDAREELMIAHPRATNVSHFTTRPMTSEQFKDWVKYQDTDWWLPGPSAEALEVT